MRYPARVVCLIGDDEHCWSDDGVVIRVERHRANCRMSSIDTAWAEWCAAERRRACTSPRYRTSVPSRSRRRVPVLVCGVRVSRNSRRTPAQCKRDDLVLGGSCPLPLYCMQWRCVAIAQLGLIPKTRRCRGRYASRHRAARRTPRGARREAHAARRALRGARCEARAARRTLRGACCEAAFRMPMRPGCMVASQECLRPAAARSLHAMPSYV
jgi:hypothetical protein